MREREGGKERGREGGREGGRVFVLQQTCHISCGCKKCSSGSHRYSTTINSLNYKGLSSEQFQIKLISHLLSSIFGKLSNIRTDNFIIDRYFSNQQCRKFSLQH